MVKDYSILIGGEAGQGSRMAGLILAKIFNHWGYYVYIYEDYQSLIRGGHNFSEVRISWREFHSRKEKIDFLLALDKKTIELHRKNLTENGIIIFNKEKFFSKEGFGISADKIVKEEGGSSIMVNTALISAFSKAVGIEWMILEKVFKKEIPKETSLNLKIAQRAFREVKILRKIPKLKKEPIDLLTGNEATALGLSSRGLKFYFAYPMTPATSLMNFFARKEELGVKAIQPENEIAVINMALGAAFAGAKSAVGTSGGGFALMTEALSLSGQSETPIVIIESQRAGPSTGAPTYNMQADLLFALYAGHGDFPRFLLAPANAKQCFSYSALALDLAWKYQTPAIILLDKDLSENTFSINEKKLISKKIRPVFWTKKGEYQRYLITKNGISPLLFPGEKNNIVKAASYEHDEFGLTTEKEEIIEKMQKKRMRKYEEMKKEIEKLKAIEVYGKRKSKIALISFGISTGPSREAAEKMGIKMIQPIIIEPFPQKQMNTALKGVKKIFSVELNSSGQLSRILRGKGIKVDGQVLKFSGRPFFAKEIEEKIKKFL